MTHTSNLRHILSVERAISDLRSGFAVAVRHDTSTLLVFAADTVSEDILQEYSGALASPTRLILSAKRVQAIFPGLALPYKTATLPLPSPLDGHVLYQLSGLEYTDGTIACDQKDIREASQTEIAALNLIKLAELLPAAIILTSPPSLAFLQENNVLLVTPEDIAHFKTHAVASLKEACAAPLCLAGAEHASIRAYRPMLGGNEHYAIIIGDALNTPTPLVRIHSSCYTGDLLRSLRCDCGDQLHEAITFMGKDKAGGIIIYLMQEGRGIGLTNKLRTYDLQARGLDTVDANAMLGFEDDERLFLPAVKILEQLGITTLRLLTNNPKKAKGLEEYGITVAECVPHVMQSHKHNEAYLETKAKRLGHRLR